MLRQCLMLLLSLHTDKKMHRYVCMVNFHDRQACMFAYHWSHKYRRIRMRQTEVSLELFELLQYIAWQIRHSVSDAKLGIDRGETLCGNYNTSLLTAFP